MRRRLSLVVGACAAVALAGVGTIAYLGGGDRETPGTAVWNAAAEHSTPTPDAPTGSPSTSSAPRPAPATEAAPTPQATGPGPAQTGAPRDGETADAGQPIGTVETVDRTLGYLLGAERRTTLRFPGAEYVKVHFSRIALLPGDYLTVSDPQGRESHRYEGITRDAVSGLTRAVFHEGEPEATGERWAMSVSGDTAVVELHTTSADPLGLNTAFGGLGVGIDRVARGYTRPERVEAAQELSREQAGPGREESVCGGDEKSDAACYKSTDPMAYTRSKAVARLLINGTELCTAWRIGTQNRLVTNNHCFATSKDAYNTEVWFNYQCAKCGGYDVFQSTKVWGDKVLATDKTLDFTLFTVESFASVQKFGYLTLDTARPAAGTQLYIPQHPAGDPTAIAMSSGERGSNCAVDNPAYTGYASASDVSYFCDTEGGSSGSPVISRKTNKVVALHHFGGCPNSGVRADLLNERIKSLV
ncbi:trypsin-like serine peptidase [Catenuloplanes japonicus]|uniref:trypsin-like serine peptidase n=1 Tax=Catenuloplanes japonicus TaxID=33876 RepID=UPI000525B6EE|nr:serine protease [Catenuloplanes japonicus]